MEPPRSRVVEIATLLERYLALSVYIGVRGMIFFGSWFILYTIIGLFVKMSGWFDPPYPPLSLESDPFFVIGGAIVGLFVVQSAGSFLLYHFLVGVEDEKSEFAVLMGFISLGFGGALLRVTLPPALRMVSSIV
ncbi:MULTISPECIES: hypothetical protein [Halobacteriales]|uniref:Uncharacterized protein n=3 Tax=Halobacteriales TaxID=2235 RepID=A0A8U0I122_9EURY|nr:MULTISPECIES: hypothetical protein [Halobacteriales]UPV77065.1 hypothetical protein M0R89_21860 [Halorussus limi]USZ78443.1 hypothetical protein NGM07_24170 [Halorussus vallis]